MLSARGASGAGECLHVIPGRFGSDLHMLRWQMQLGLMEGGSGVREAGITDEHIMQSYHRLTVGLISGC